MLRNKQGETIRKKRVQTQQAGTTACRCSNLARTREGSLRSRKLCCMDEGLSGNRATDELNSTESFDASWMCTRLRCPSCHIGNLATLRQCTKAEAKHIASTQKALVRLSWSGCMFQAPVFRALLRPQGMLQRNHDVRMVIRVRQQCAHCTLQHKHHDERFAGLFIANDDTVAVRGRALRMEEYLCVSSRTH